MEARHQAEEIFETPDIDAPVSPINEGGRSWTGAADVNQGDPESLVPSSIDPDAAFEVFHGKKYEVLYDLSGSIAGSLAGRGSRDATHLPAAERPVESPAETYLRLKAEANQLSNDINALISASSAASADADSAGTLPGGEVEAASLWCHLSREVLYLRDQLASLADGREAGAALLRGDAGGPLGRVASQADAAEELVRRVKQLTTADRAGLEACDGGVRRSEGEVVYELYYDTSRSASRKSQIQAIESRLTAVERLLDPADGDSSTAKAVAGSVLTSRNTSIVDALATVEKQVALLDASSVDKMRQRLLLLKTDWDDFKKDRLAHANAWETHASAHFRRVEALYAQLQKLEQVENDLPALVTRLELLQDLHHQSLQFSQRLQQVEQGQASLRVLLSSTTDSLAEMKKSLAENMAQVASNIQDIDNRVKTVTDVATRRWGT